MPIVFENVSYADRTNNCLGDIRNLNLTVDDKEFLGMMGRERSGILAVAALIAALVAPDEGKVTIDGEKPDSKALNRRIGIVFRKAEELFFESTAEREIAFALRENGYSKTEKEIRVRTIMQQVGLDYDSISRVSPLSLTNEDKRAVAIASVLITQPDIIILDDPFEEMSSEWCKNLLALLRRLNDEGKCILLLSNDSDILSECAERIIVFDKGRIALEGSTKSVFSEYYALMQMGFDVPETRICSQLLRERGIEMPNNIIDYEQFIDRLKILMWRKKR